MRGKWILTLVVAAAAVVAVFAATRFRSPDRSGNPSMVQRVAAERGEIRILVSASGVLEPIYQVEVKSKASGLIERMPVEEGDTVGRGDLLAELDRTEAKSEHDQAEANLASAEANLQYLETQLARQDELYRQHLISDLEMEETNLNLVQARSQKIAAGAALTSAAQRLEDTVVRSPIDGVILGKSVEAGQIISSGISSVTGGTTIAIVADMSKMLVKTSVDEVDIGKVKVGQPAAVTPDAYPYDTSNGEVIRISAQGQVEQNVTTFEVTVQIPNPELRLKAGMNCSVDLLVAERSDAVLVPAEAVGGSSILAKWRVLVPELEVPTPPETKARGEREGQYVIVMEEDGPTVRPVRVGLRDVENVEITEGLAEGEEVLVVGYSRALQARAEFQERIRARSMGGFRRTD